MTCRQLIAALEFSVVSTTHDFEWARQRIDVVADGGVGEETGTYTNYAGRVQITNRAVMPPGDAQPLHVLMAELLNSAGIQVSHDPAAIFEWITR